MSEAVAVSLIALVGTVVTAAATVAAAYARSTSRRLGNPNGWRSLSDQIDALHRLVTMHIAHDEERFEILFEERRRGQR